MSDKHRCDTPAIAQPGREWTCPDCGRVYFATDDDGGNATFHWLEALQTRKAPGS